MSSAFAQELAALRRAVENPDTYLLPDPKKSKEETKLQAEIARQKMVDFCTGKARTSNEMCAELGMSRGAAIYHCNVLLEEKRIRRRIARRGFAYIAIEQPKDKP